MDKTMEDDNVSDTSFSDIHLSEIDSDDSLDDDFNPNQREQDPREQLEEPGGFHPFHACSSCRLVDIDFSKSSRQRLWADFRVRPSDANNECEFFGFCRSQHLQVPTQTTLRVKIDLEDGRPAIGCNVAFSFSPNDNVWSDRDFVKGRVHPGPGNPCNCTQTPLRQQPNLEVFEKARLKMKECELGHPLCPKKGRAFAPLRLIHIHTSRHIILHLPDPDHKIEYAVLSYCWGGPQQCETRRANFAERMTTGMLISELSKTLQEAIEVTSKLGIRYLWADCLCIIQDNITDKEEQIVQMPEIYAAAEVTIAASCARNTSEGFLTAKPPPQKVFQFSTEEYGSIHVLVQDRVFDGFEPLDTRAWALQEAALSIRTVNFKTLNVRFECSSSVITLDNEGDLYQVVPFLRQLNRALLSDSEHVFRRADIWLRLVEEYSRRHLTFPDDRLLAISGLGDRFGSILNSNYLAGLWESQLPRDLLWRCVLSQPRPLVERAPSWSWASIDGPVSYDVHLDPLKQNEHMELHSISVLPLRMDAMYGSVRSGGSICVSSLFKPAKVIRKNDQLSLVDVKTRIGLRSKLHFDYDIDEAAIVDGVIFMFNYFKPEGLLHIKESATHLYTLGFLLLPVKERIYKRIGMYDAQASTEWFKDSSFETIHIV